ncbi:MAG TPA: DUF1761 domain-containing protein [Ferruginibacter sp.]|nr:DUF1761 domain-containing protein [Ferruginibacter sp.]
MQPHINHLAVLVCAMANLAVGALWYSPVLFYKAWKKENNLTDEQLKNINPAKVYGITFLLSVIISYNMVFFVGDQKTDMAWGTTAGFLTGFGFCALIFTIVGLFEQRSWKYIFINSGYIIVYFTLSGFILGTWR